MQPALPRIQPFRPGSSGEKEAKVFCGKESPQSSDTYCFYPHEEQSAQSYWLENVILHAM